MDKRGAAGLPILPGLARYDEICGTGKLTHALRFTVKKTRRAYVPPATHFASPHKDENLPPMGMRVRLKAGFDTSKFTGAARVILEGLKTHGMILADNGGDWFIQRRSRRPLEPRGTPAHPQGQGQGLRGREDGTDDDPMRIAPMTVATSSLPAPLPCCCCPSRVPGVRGGLHHAGRGHDPVPDDHESRGRVADRGR